MELNVQEFKVEVQREAHSKVVLKIEVPADEVHRAVERAYRRLVQRTEIPGFRRGKAPRPILERYLGKETLFDEAANILAPEAFRKAIRQTGLDPIGVPKVDVQRLEEGKPALVTVEVEVMPEVQLGDYTSIRIPWQDPQVTEEDVAQALEDLRNQHGVLLSVPDAQAAEGDYVLARVEAVEGTERFRLEQELLIEIGSHTFPHELEEALLGARVGEQREVSFSSEHGAGKVSLRVADIKRKELPPLDDAFAKVAAGVATLEELKAQFRERLKASAEEEARAQYEAKVVDTLIAQSTIEVPRSLVNSEVDELVEELRKNLQRQGLSLEYYLVRQQKTLEDVRRDLEPLAERRLKMAFLLEEVAKREGISVSEEEINEQVEKLATTLGQDPSHVRNRLEEGGDLSRLATRMRIRKAVDRLVAIARGNAPKEERI
ncbi:MAG: trigger factor [Armatimonadota bacterium]|nr:trigger factor [Armatimonadota bacterium]MDR5703463.1 trigger factor [Armatimonadota bacterium]MDR7435547.1 trigger factor [Armatimonadota bacterium]